MRDDDPESGIRRGTEDRQGLTRRRLVAAGAATWASVGLAGCDRIDDPGPPGGDGGDGDGSDGDGDGDDGNGSDGNGTTVSNRTTTTTGVGDGDDGTTPSNESTTTSPGDGETTTTTTTTEEPTTTTTEEPTTTDCASIRRFAAGMEIGLHVDVYDSETGEYLGDDGLDRVRVSFPDAPFDPLDLSWEGPHEQYSSDGWGGKLTPDADVESGTYRYEITVTGDGIGGEAETVEDRFTIVT